MARSVVESILAGKEAGLRASERVQQQFERMALAQQEAERYREQRELEGAERVFKFGLSQLEDVEWNIRTPDEQKAPVIGSTQAAAKRLGIEWSYMDPIPEAITKDIWKLKTDPLWRTKSPAERMVYLKDFYGRHWYSLKQELLDQAKVSGLMEEEAARGEEVKKKTWEAGERKKEIAKEELAKQEAPAEPATEFEAKVWGVEPRQLGPIATERFAEVPEVPVFRARTREEIEAEALFGDAYDELSMEDASKVANMLKTPEMIETAVPLWMLSEDGRRSVRNMAIYQVGVSTEEWEQNPEGSARQVVVYYKNRAEQRRQQKNELVLGRALPEIARAISLTRTPEERDTVAALFWSRLPSYNYIDPTTGEYIASTMDETTFKGFVKALQPWTYVQEVAAKQAGERIELQKKALDLRKMQIEMNNDIQKARVAISRARAARTGAARQPSLTTLMGLDARFGERENFLRGMVESGQEYDGTDWVDMAPDRLAEAQRYLSETQQQRRVIGNILNTQLPDLSAELPAEAPDITFNIGAGGWPMGPPPSPKGAAKRRVSAFKPETETALTRAAKEGKKGKLTFGKWVKGIKSIKPKKGQPDPKKFNTDELKKIWDSA